MELKEIVTSLELSKRLTELGVKQESIFYWNVWYVHGAFRNADLERSRMGYENNKTLSCRNYSAFTASELGEMLPVFSSGYNELSIEKSNIEKWIVKYECSRTREASFSDGNLCNALAKMLIHLIENKLWEPR